MLPRHHTDHFISILFRALALDYQRTVQVLTALGRKIYSVLTASGVQHFKNALRRLK